jgi:N-acetylglutamate synthase-like GNAT family acetyltransferase
MDCTQQMSLPAATRQKLAAAADVQPAAAPSTIRFATAQDLDALVQLNALSWQEMRPPAQDEQRASAGVVAGAVSAMVGQLADKAKFAAQYGDPESGRGAFWVAEREAQVLACVACTKQTDYDLELLRMVVHPANRREGLGKQLVQRVAEYAREHGYANIELVCASPSGQSLYASCGFRAVQTWRRQGIAPARFVRAVAPLRFTRVLLVGGVHGNELLGSHLVVTWAGGSGAAAAGELSEHPDVKRRSFQTYTWLGCVEVAPRGLADASRGVARRGMVQQPASPRALRAVRGPGLEPLLRAGGRRAERRV